MRIAIVSRCARTLAVFRTNLLTRAIAEHADVVALGAGGDGFENRLAAAGIPFESMPVSFKGFDPRADLALLRAFARFFSRWRPDVVHSFTIKPAIFATLAASYAGVPVRVVTITGLGYAFTSAGGLLRRVVEFLYRAALRRAHVVMFQNSVDRELFIARALVRPEATRLVAGSGVDTRRFAVAPLPGVDGAPVFLMVGRLLRDKGVLEYLAAARILRQRIPGARCRLLGAEDPRNPSRLTVEELTALRASPDVELLAETDDVRPIIAAADVVVLPSYREGLPRSLLEGGAMGRALIATDVPGCNAVVKHGVNGLLVPRADAAALADAMSRLAQDPQLVAAFGAAARAGIVAEFDEQKVIDDTLATYRSLYAQNATDR